MTDKQELFAAEYLKDCNRTEAAKRAGYSEKTAYSIGSELLKKPEIRALIQKHVDDALTLSKITLKKDVIDELIKEAFPADPDYNPNVKMKALEMLGKYMVMFTDKTEMEHSGKVEHNVRSWGEVMGGDGPETK